MKKVLVFQHVPHEGLGTIQTHLEKQNVAIAYCNLFDGHTPPKTLDHIDFVVAMGGPMNCDEVDRYPFLALERTCLEQAIKSDVPVLGICLGSQMLASALGACVYQANQKEIGWHAISISKEGMQDGLFRGASGNQATVLQWHGDTFDLPRNSVRLASSAICENQAFRSGSHTYGLQFHIEVTGSMIRNWIVENKEELESLSGLVYPSEIEAGIHLNEPTMETLAAPMYEIIFSPLKTGVKHA